MTAHMIAQGLASGNGPVMLVRLSRRFKEARDQGPGGSMG